MEKIKLFNKNKNKVWTIYCIDNHYCLKGGRINRYYNDGVKFNNMLYGHDRQGATMYLFYRDIGRGYKEKIEIQYNNEWSVGIYINTVCHFYAQDDEWTMHDSYRVYV